jgi:NAD(P)-dependent dehydrogenase (short-subunit alcohol dehydrogenase family)
MLEQTRQGLDTIAQSDQQILIQSCDVSDPLQVRNLIEATLSLLGSIQILVNNAGVYGPKGLIEEIDWQEWTRAMEINLYGTVLPTMQVLPHMRENGYGKIIFLSGGGATKPMPRMSAYAVSKAAVVRFMETIAEENRNDNIDCNAVAPGALATRMLDEVIEAGPDVVGEAFYERMVQIKQDGGTPLHKGADLCVFLASGESDGITGKLLSAVWDPWQNLPQHKKDLKGDVYTLRRIIPHERGMDWGEVE